MALGAGKGERGRPRLTLPAVLDPAGGVLWVERAPRALRAAAEACLSTSAADERFVLERRGPMVVGSACSGQSSTFAPLVGQRLAELAA